MNTVNPRCVRCGGNIALRYDVRSDLEPEARCLMCNREPETRRNVRQLEMFAAETRRKANVAP